MKLLKLGTKYTKFGDISLGVPDLIPAQPEDPGPLYVEYPGGINEALIKLTCKYLKEYWEETGFARDACYHPGHVALENKYRNLGALIDHWNQVLGK